MKQTPPDPIALTPVIQAALLRRPVRRVHARPTGVIERKGGGGAKKSENNYIAEPPLSHGKKKRKPGAPRGNRNAVRSGCFTAEARATRKRNIGYFREMMLLVRAIRAAARANQPFDAYPRRFMAVGRKIS